MMPIVCLGLKNSSPIYSKMTFTLAIESSTPLLTLALFKHKDFVDEVSNREVKKTHSEFLIPMIDQFLNKHQLDIKNIDRFCISNGPGGFTSIRVGLASLLGLLVPTPKPFSLVSTLKVQANSYFQNQHDYDVVISTLRAGRGRIYIGLYQRNIQTNLAINFSNFSDQVIPVDTIDEIISDYLGKNSWGVIGEGQKLIDGNLNFIDEIYPTAKSVGQIAIHNNHWLKDPLLIQPAYLQEPDIG